MWWGRLKCQRSHLRGLTRKLGTPVQKVALQTVTDKLHTVQILLFYLSCLMLSVPCFVVSCFMPSCVMAPASCLVSHFSCLMIPCLEFHISCRCVYFFVSFSHALCHAISSPHLMFHSSMHYHAFYLMFHVACVMLFHVPYFVCLFQVSSHHVLLLSWLVDAFIVNKTNVPRDRFDE